MRRALIPALLLVLLSVVLGATVFREPVAWAAQAVDATIIGPLDGNGNVRVHEQGTANVRVTDNPARSPFVTVRPLSLADGDASAFGPVATVPLGKRLVIDYISGRMNVPTGQTGAFELTAQDGQTGLYFFPATFVGTSGGFNSLYMSETTQIYADSGQRVEAGCRRFGPSLAGSGSCQLTVSGHFVDL
jgi:hypothetical protein